MEHTQNKMIDKLFWLALKLERITDMAVFCSLVQVLIRCVVLLASGLATYHLLLTPIWTSGISELHVGRSTETAIGACTVPWAKDVTVVQSLIAEIVGTFILDIGKKALQRFTN